MRPGRRCKIVFLVRKLRKMLNQTQRSAHLRLIGLILLLMLFSALCWADQSDLGGSYEKKANWQETMLACRELYQQFLANPQSGELNVEMSPWYTTGPLAAESFSNVLFPEKGVDINVKDENEQQLWQANPELIDGRVHIICKESPVSVYFFRTITVEKAQRFSAGFGSNDGLEVWLNEKKLLSNNTSRMAAPDQDTVVLDLVAGENRLLAKVFNRANVGEFYFSLNAEPSVILWEQIEKDFPYEAGWFKRELDRNEVLDWFRAKNNIEIETKLIGGVIEKTSPASKDLQSRFEFMLKAGISAGDSGWLDLYTEACKLDEALTSLKHLDINNVQNAVRCLKGTLGGQRRPGEFLERISSYEKRIGTIEAILARPAEIDNDKIQIVNSFIDDVFDSLRELFVRRCPPIVFLKRTARGRKGTNGTMLGQINRGVKMGSKICIFDPQHPEEGTRTIFDSEKGFIFDMSLSYDAKKILFSFMDNIKENIKAQKDSFHIWEINIDGSGLRQLTDGPFHDGSAVYLPDGRIVFCSTRVQSFSVCQDFLAAAMYIMNGDGSGLRRLEYNTLCDTTPFVMDDGLILFTRWEYQDKNIFCVQGLWTINPAGERVQLFHGNTFTIPNSVCHARQIPGTRKILCTLAPHHGRPLGAIGIIDRDLGFETVESIVNITPEIPYQPRKGESWYRGANNSWRPGDRIYDWAYGDPYPIAEDLFLVAYGGPIEGGPKRYRLCLLDDRGNKVEIYEDPTTSCFNPIPLKPRPLPHKIPGNISEPEGEGVFFVSDIYQGLLHKGVKRGQIKQLLIMSQLPKKYNTEGPRYHDHYPIIGQGSYYVKYCYGTVPVYEDGTAYFKAPAGVELYFIAIDKDGKEIRRMGTVTQITAGERQGCVGCHESRFTAAPGNRNLMSRVNREPDSITAPPWGAGPVGFVEQVQPILDKYCVSCHSGRAPKGRVDLSGDKSRFYNMAYRTLVDRKLVEYYYINQGPTGNFKPLASGSWVSKLTEMIEKEHSGVKMDDQGRRRIYNWIDGNAPYYKTWNMSRPHTQGGRDTWHRLKDGKRGSIEDEPWFAEFKKTFESGCSSCHSVKPDWINLTHSEYSRVLNAHLSKEAGGYGLTKTKDGKKPPVFAGTDDAVYQALLKAIEGGRDALYARPRVDMPGARPIAQERNFGRLY